MDSVQAAIISGDAREVGLSVVIPAYNEEHRIRKTLEHAAEYFRQKGDLWKDYEIIVVCDGCTDATESVAQSSRRRDANLRVISYPRNRGKGYALRTGVLASRGRYVLMMDADGSTPLVESEALLKPVAAGTSDIAIGSRRIAGARIETAQPWHRRLMGVMFGWLMRRILGMPFQDTQCGFKLFDGLAGRRLFRWCECGHFAIDVELLFRARKMGLRVVEIGVVWNDVVGSHVSPVRDALKMLGYALWLRSFGRNARILPATPSVSSHVSAKVKPFSALH